MKSISSRFHQKGLTTVEFSLVGTVLFVVLFGLIEFGRLMFTWNVLDEATRRAARLATVCPLENELTGGSAFARKEGAFSGDLLPAFTSENIWIEYLQQDGSAATLTEDTFYVRASVVGYTHQLLIPFFNLNLTPKGNEFETTLPAESLGVHPSAAGAAPCNP